MKVKHQNKHLTMTDYKALYEQQLEENKKLLKRLTHNTKLIRKLKDEVKYLENEVCRYSNAIEEEYVLKSDYQQLELNSVECHCDHCNMWLSYDDLNISLGVGHRCCEMCFEEKKLKDRDDIIKELKEKRDMCDFCDNERCHLVKRDAGYDEWTCETCYKEQYPTEEEEEEEVKEKILKDICIHCDRKKKGPGDMFIVHQDLNCPKEEWCGECYMMVERYKLKSYP